MRHCCSSPARRRLVLVLGGVVLASASGCVNRFWRTEARSVARPAAGDSGTTLVRTPVKVHLADGGTIVFRRGASITRDRIAGDGEAYALLRSTPTRRESVPMDSVVGLETFEAKLLQAPTYVTSIAATAVGAVATVALLKAVFGSCPTIYADTGDGSGAVLQAEGFSYSIAPLFEQRDLDPLRVRPDVDGTVRLELRNEALETHWINHVELLAVRHAADTRVVPDQSGRPVEVGALRPIDEATDRAGRDLRDVLSAADGRLFASAPATVDAARVGDLDDWIDVEADGLPPGDSVAVVLRLRNSLLNTVLLYDGMLGGRDAPDWLASGLQHISTAVDLSRWYARTMGMHASLGGAEARLADVGPLAFRDVAIVLPRPSRADRRVRVRLRFVADDWRIDAISLGGVVSRPETRTVALSRVVVPTPAGRPGAAAAVDGAALDALAAPDDRYLQTQPGQRMILEFAGARGDAAPSSTTYLIAWQGWYQEWIRGRWLAEPTRTTPFVPGDSAMAAALRRWTPRRGELERAFYSSRVPVR